MSLAFTVTGGTPNVFDIYRNGSLLYPSNTGTTFDNYPVTAGSNYSYYVIVRLTTGNSITSNTVTVSVPANVCGMVHSASMVGDVLSQSGSAVLFWPDSPTKFMNSLIDRKNNTRGNRGRLASRR